MPLYTPSGPIYADALDEALAAMDSAGRAYAARHARIDADPRVVWLRSARPMTNYGYGFVGAAQVFSDMADGTSARRARIASLVRARIGQIDGNRAAVRKSLADAAATRRQEVIGRLKAEGVAALARLDATLAAFPEEDDDIAELA